MVSDYSRETEEVETTVIRSKQYSAFYSVTAMFLWLGPICLNISLPLALLIFCRSATSAMSILVPILLLVMIPVNERSWIGELVSRYIGKYVPGHFPVTVHLEDSKAFDQNKSYGESLQPNHTQFFPLVASHFWNITGLMPLAKTKALASTAVFYTPLLRHITTWMGLVPATKVNFFKYLRAGYSCIVIPGGVQEVIYMDKNYEVAFLKRRFGFVRVAIETGSPLVPIFCFGQRDVYKWWKPNNKFYIQIARLVRFAPLIFWGAFSSPIPYRRPINVVVGKPIEFKQNSNPSKEEVAEAHAHFLSSLESLFLKYRVILGDAATELKIL